MLVFLEQQRPQAIGQFRPCECLLEGTDQAHRADRVRNVRRADAHAQLFEALVQQFERARQVPGHRFRHVLPGDVEIEVGFLDQPHRRRVRIAAGAIAQVVEVAREQFAIAHDEAGAARAQAEQHGQVDAILRAAALADPVLQAGFDRREQFARQVAELFDHDPLELVQQPQSLVVADQFDAELGGAHALSALAPRSCALAAE